MRLQVRHRTTYHYSEPVTLGHTEARLMPPDRGRQRRLSFDLQVFPTPKVCHSREDAFGNAVTRFSVETPHEELVVEAHSLMEIAPAEVELPLAGPPTVAEVQKAFRDPQTEAQRLHRLFCLPSAYVPQLPELRDYGLESFHPQRDVVAATKELMERIHDDFQYDPTATEVATPLREVFEGRRGVCQDFAHCALGVLRALGLPAAYCSGYLETNPTPGGEKLVGADASHAWFALYMPEQGWLEFDPTNRQRPTERYVFLGQGRDYGDAAPLRGIVQGGGQHEVHVSVDVLAQPPASPREEGNHDHQLG